MPTLFDPITLGDVEMSNRMFMSPCTRNRADLDEVPTPVMTDYYAQRAGSGLIIAEGISPEPRGRGYYRVPGAFNDRQEQAWRPVAEAVHARGGRIFGQIMHCGRIAHAELQPGGELPIAPSAVRPDPAFRGYTYACPKPDRPYDTPRALELDEIPALIDSFGESARRLVAAGFDGVELHAASGYLPNQFLASNSNRRTDAYGGDIPRRSRFVLDVVDAMIGAVGAGRVAVKLAPAFRFHDVHDEDAPALYAHLAGKLSERGLAYVQASTYGDYYSYDFDPIALVREHYRGPLVANGGFNRESGSAILAQGKAEAVAFGTAFIANPDLVERFRTGAALNVPDPSTFYTEGAEGYTDYPFMDEATDRPTTTEYGGSSAADLETYQHGTKVG